MTLNDLKPLLRKAKPKQILHRPGLNACCPAHDDENPSFCVWEGADGWLHVHCRTGCSEEQILAALGMEQEDRRMHPRADKEPTRETVYTYRDADGRPVLRKIRIERFGHAKTFRLEGYWDDAWHGSLVGLKEARYTLYNLSAVRQAILQGRTIYLNEGEKACDYMGGKGLVGTCQAMGASATPGSQWKQEHSAQLKGAKVAIVADRDAVGEGYAKYVAAQLTGVAKSVRVVQSRSEGEKDDAYDHLAQGFTEADWIERRDLLPPRGLKTSRFLDHSFLAVEVEYLVEPYLPKGKCVLLDADGGTGKTSLALAWAAQLSSGFEPVTGSYREPARTLYLHKGEDESEELATVFRANGGSFENIEFYDGDLAFDSAGVSRLEETILDGGFSLVVVDAFFYFLVGMMDDTNNALPALAVMQRLNSVASRTECTFWNIRHTKKGIVGAKASDMGMGSVQFRNSHRGQILLRYHPRERGVVVATDEKGSLLVPRGEHFCYRREGMEVLYLPQMGNPFEEPEPTDDSKFEQAKQLVRKLCERQWMRASNVRRHAEEQALAWRTVQRAAQSLGVRYQKLCGGETSWSLLEQEVIDPYEAP